MSRRMGLSRAGAGILTLFILAGLGCGTELDKKDMAKAKSASEAWLKLVDGGRYEPSWEQAATLFKLAVTRQAWSRMAGAVRKPLGDLISRSLVQAAYKNKLPGAPDGDYVVLRHSTSFGHKKEAVETVTVMLDKDGRWRVSGYFIK